MIGAAYCERKHCGTGLTFIRKGWEPGVHVPRQVLKGFRDGCPDRNEALSPIRGELLAIHQPLCEFGIRYVDWELVLLDRIRLFRRFDFEGFHSKTAATAERAFRRAGTGAVCRSRSGKMLSTSQRRHATHGMVVMAKWSQKLSVISLKTLSDSSSVSV